MEFIESQRPIYVLRGSETRVKPSDEGFESKFCDRSDGDFMKLLNGKEPDKNVKLRYELYKQNWKKQMSSINNVLLKTDRFKFRSLREFLKYRDRKFDDRLISGVLNLGSNISNHERLLVNVCRYLREEEDICLIRVNPRVDFNIQKIIKKIEEGMVYELRERGNGKKSKKSKSRKRRRMVGTMVEENDGKEPIYNVVKGKFVDVVDMLKEFRRLKIRLVIMIENGDSMNRELIEKVLNLLHEYNLNGEVYCLICISTPFIMFEEKISVLTIGKLKSSTFSIDNSKEAIGQIMEDLLININETYNSLIFEPKLVLKFLRMKEDMSIEKFKKMIKMIYMRHYFSQPLSIFWTKDFSKIELRKIYFEVFKTLPSVIDNTGDDEENSNFLKQLTMENQDIDNKVIGEMLRYNLNKLINWRYELRGLIDFLNFLQAIIINASVDKLWDNNLELFEMIFGKYYQIKEEGGSERVILRKMVRVISKVLENLWRVIGKDKDTVAKIQSIVEEEFMKGFDKTSGGLTEVVKYIEKTIASKIIMLDLEGQMFREVCVVDEDALRGSVEGDNPPLRENVLMMLEEMGGMFTGEVWQRVQEAGASRLAVSDLATVMDVEDKERAAWLVRAVWELDTVGVVSVDKSRGAIDRVIWRGV